MNLKSINEHPSYQWIILGVLSVIWGSSFILMKKGLESFSAAQVGSVRIVFASLVLLPIALRNFKKVYKANWKKFLTLGLIANFIPAILFATAETGLSSSLTGILNSLTPMFTFIIGIVAFKNHMNFKQAIGLVIGFSGTLILTFVGNNGEPGSFNYFALFVIAATTCYGISGNMVKTYFSNVNSVVLTSLAMFSIGPIGFIYLTTTDFFSKLATQPSAWESLGFVFLLGVVGTALAVILFNRLIQYTTAVFATSVTYLIPIVAVFWGLLDGESLYPLHFLGMFIIIIGVYIVNNSKKRLKVSKT